MMLFLEQLVVEGLPPVIQQNQQQFLIQITLGTASYLSSLMDGDDNVWLCKVFDFCSFAVTSH